MRTWSLAVLFAFAPTCLAWNKSGHMVSGAIAYQVLKAESPQTIPKVIAVLKEHPQYETLWAPRLNAIPNLTDEDRDLYLFMQAARWPDDARSSEEFHHSKWHYINLPYKPPGQPESVAAPPPDADNIVRAYALNLERVKNPREEAEDRAVALCWVFHLIGDGHQPLHTSSLYTTQYPKGDKGGNRFYIKARPGSSPIPLHAFWDDLILGSERFQSVRNKAIELRLRPEHASGKLTELRESSFEKWIEAESFRLVSEVVYRRGDLKGGSDEGSATVLPEDYARSCKPVAERQIVLSAYRLAAVLRDAVKDRP